MTSINEKIQYLANTKRPIVIFGAGIIGEILFHACIKSGIKIACYCDNNKNKISETLCGLKVIHSSDLVNLSPTPEIIISAADIKDVIDQLKTLGEFQWHPGSELLQNFDISEIEFNSSYDFAEYAVATCINCHNAFLNPEKLFLRSVDIIITEKCSLKCRDCSNLMQYYDSPSNCDTQAIFESIDAFCHLADEINEFRVIGGEPLMNPQYHLIIEKLVNEPKVRKVVIYTNGTIIPSEDKIKYLQHDKVLFLITNYGANLSKNLNKLISKLQHNNIAYYSFEAKGWTLCSQITKHGRSEDDQVQLFNNCCAKNTTTLSDGKLYRCPFSANSNRLKAIPEYSSDFVNIHSNKDKATLKNEVRNFLMNIQYLKSCDYCNGRSFGAPEITPAIQTDKPLAYKKY